MEIYEILNKIDDESSKNKKIQILMDNDSVGLRTLMRINFDPDLLLYVNDTEWNPNTTGNYKTLSDNVKFLAPLAKKTTNRQRATESFKSLLEALHPIEAQYLLDAKNKKLKIRGLTLRLAEEIWGKRIFN
jgi:hypothetical protein